MPTPAEASTAANCATAERWDGGPLWDPVKTATRTTSSLSRAVERGAMQASILRTGFTGGRVLLDRRLGDLRARPPALGSGRRGRAARAPRRRRRAGAVAAAAGGLVAPRRHVGDAGRRAARRGVARARGPARGPGGARPAAPGPGARPLLGRRPRRLVLHDRAGPPGAQHRAGRPAAGRRERGRGLGGARRPGVVAAAPGFRGVAVPPARPAVRLTPRRSADEC